MVAAVVEAEAEAMDWWRQGWTERDCARLASYYYYINIGRRRRCGRVGKWRWESESPMEYGYHTTATGRCPPACSLSSLDFVYCALCEFVTEE